MLFKKKIKSDIWQKKLYNEKIIKYRDAFNMDMDALIVLYSLYIDDFRFSKYYNITFDITLN